MKTTVGHQMTEHEAISITRNPWGKPERMVVKARLTVCESLEAWRDAYENMRQYAIDQGLNVTAHPQDSLDNE